MRVQRAQSHDHGYAKAPPNVVYAQLKFMWARGAQEETLNHLRAFTAKLAQDIQTETGDQHRPTVSKTKMGELTKLLARCYFKQGEWQATLKD